VHHQHTYYE